MIGCSTANTRRALLAALPLAFASACTTLGGVVDREAKTVTWKCDGEAKVTLQTHAVVVTCPAGPAPTLTVQTPGEVAR